MVKTATTPPEEEDVSGILISDLSNPIWGELLRLLEDQEQAAVVLDILVQAITSRAIEEDLPDASREEHVERASALVASKLSEIEELTGATDLQRRQQLLLATRTIITDAISATMQAHARKVREAHEVSSHRNRDSLAAKDAENERLSLQLESVREAGEQVASTEVRLAAV